MDPMRHSQPRVPTFCPPGFQGRYTVVPGDTMFLIAQRFGVSLDALIAADPQIPNPNLIFPGDVLCVPGTAPPPPPPQEPCPCPATLFDFLGRVVQVTTPCGLVSGYLDSVNDNSIILIDNESYRTIIVPCREICFVRVLRRVKNDD